MPLAGNALAVTLWGPQLGPMAIMTGHADVAFATAGQSALLGVWRVAPPFGMMTALSRLFGFPPPAAAAAFP